MVADAGLGLRGDRYSTGNGSFNKDKPGSRQVTIMNSIFFEGSGFEFKDSRRNLFVEGVELMWLIGRDFQIGTAVNDRSQKLYQRQTGTAIFYTSDRRSRLKSCVS